MDHEDGTEAEDLDFIKESLRSALKNSLSDERLATIAKEILDAEITKNFAHLVTAEDLASVGLGKFEKRALLEHWKLRTIQTQRSGETAPEHEQQPIVQEAVTGPRTLIHILDFRINWDPIHRLEHKGKLARNVLEGKQQPEKGLQCKIVAEVVGQVASRLVEPNRKSFEPIYTQMVEKYPDSFKEDIGKGTESVGGLLHKLKTRWDNQYTRPERNASLKDKALLQRQYEKPRGKFSYGCVRWRIQDFPPGLNPATIEEHKEAMKKIYEEQRPKFWDWDTLEPMLQETYKSQRDMINKNITDALAQEAKEKGRKRKQAEESDEAQVDEPANDNEEHPATTISMIHEEWPFLFSFKGMLVHYKTLTQVDIEQELEIFKEKDQGIIIQFFKSQAESDERYSRILKDMKKQQKKKTEENFELRAIILLLAVYFGEESLVETVEETMTMEILSQQKTAPIFPCITAPAKKKSIFKAKKFFLGVDWDYRNSLISFEKAFMSLYMMYFVFNLQYVPESQITLEFIQRFVFHVDPPKGHKRPLAPKQKDGRNQQKKVVKPKYSTKVVHPDVSRLCNKLLKLKKKVQEESEDSLDSDDEMDIEAV